MPQILHGSQRKPGYYHGTSMKTWYYHHNCHFYITFSSTFHAPHLVKNKHLKVHNSRTIDYMFSKGQNLSDWIVSCQNARRNTETVQILFR